MRGLRLGLSLTGAAASPYGPELVVNGTFTTDTTGWIPYNSAALSVASGRLLVTGGAAGYPLARQAVPTVTGHTYRIVADYERGTAGAVFLNVADNTVGLSTTGPGTFDATFVASGSATNVDLIADAAGSTAYFDNISVREVL